MTSRLIGSGWIWPTVRPSKGQSDVLQAIDHSVTGSMTAQPPGIRPSTLRVATHGQQVASLGGSYPSAEVQSAYSTAPADRTMFFYKDEFSITKHTKVDMPFNKKAKPNSYMVSSIPI